ncbi:hypothetical protein [Massilibacteroides sp.]|uniref:hypothetical protein n=1 Tax=Massilibacteroides sp. TaxID=2034766 RepID=UPI002619A10E|nr:hypothetical protein [Massilibacteroides sp.]MDD4514772.1 hypothetical protein [Massilibacteroides sp.]
MKKFITCVVLFIINTFVFSQTNLRISDLRTMGMGGSNITHSFYFNPSCLSLSTSQFIDINYFNKYQLKELSSVSIVYGNSEFQLPFAFHISTFGYDKYRETMFRLVLSKRVSSEWIVGISTQYALLQTELYEAEVKKLSTDIGILYIPDENLLIGLSITDFPSIRLDKESIHIEDFNYYSIQTGCQYQFINNLLIASSIRYTNQSALRIYSGLEYTVYNDFYLRTGLQTNPVIPVFGVGMKRPVFHVDMAVNYHLLLGISSGIGITYLF